MDQVNQAHEKIQEQFGVDRKEYPSHTKPLHNEMSKISCLYVGMVFDTQEQRTEAVSVSVSRRRAGDLARKWIEENSSPDRHPVKKIQVLRVNGSDYIELSRKKIELAEN